MPLITIILSKMGIINPQLLKQVRGVAIVIIFFIAAVVTPPDIVSQCMVAGPMVLLYFISILLSGIFYKPRSEDVRRRGHGRGRRGLRLFHPSRKRTLLLAGCAFLRPVLCHSAKKAVLFRLMHKNRPAPCSFGRSMLY